MASPQLFGTVLMSSKIRFPFGRPKVRKVKIQISLGKGFLTH